MNISKTQKILLDQLILHPGDVATVSNLLKSVEYSSEDLSLVAIHFIKHCENLEDISECENMSKYIYPVIEMLLTYGLDPNAIIDNDNVMDELTFIKTPYAAADTMRLLLEHGGNVDLEVAGEHIFQELDFDIDFGSVEMYDRVRYDSLVHCWFVMLAFWAETKGAEGLLDVFPAYDSDFDDIGEFDIRWLKDHRKYTYGLSHVPGRGVGWSLHIFDKETLWEVARL